MAAILTKQMLIDAKACEDQVAAFERLFGDSVNVTVAKARKVAKVFEWDFARRFLDAEGLAECERVTAAALAEYERVRAAAWAEYKRVTAPALAEYERVRAAAWAKAYIATCKRRAGFKGDE